MNGIHVHPFNTLLTNSTTAHPTLKMNYSTLNLITLQITARLQRSFSQQNATAGYAIFILQLASWWRDKRQTLVYMKALVLAEEMLRVQE